jgi:predicted NUDIX family NTP pyrophosphohydrolase
MKKSAGILLYKFSDGKLLVFLVHPGGPFWKNKDAGSWSIPKGEFTDDEDPLRAAIREFEEETGTKLTGDFTALEPVQLKSGKTVWAWALECDLDPELLTSNDFEMEWPPKSGKMLRFPEIDKGAWLTVEEARMKINGAQSDFIDQLGRLS